MQMTPGARAAGFVEAAKTLPLRWQLVIAFLSVSTIPVLLATLVAAQLIAGLFRENMERWLGDAARYVLLAADEDAAEKARDATVVAAALSTAANRQGLDFLALSPELLVASGYDIVIIYDDPVRPIQVRGDVPGGAWLPTAERSGFFLATDTERHSLLLGATRRMVIGGAPYFIFIGDRWDRGILNLPGGTGAALQVRAFAISVGRVVHPDSDTRARWQVPAAALARLAAGAEQVLERVNDSDVLATVFAALRDDEGRLVGVVACRLPPNLALLSHVRTFEVFVFLVLAAGLISGLVALFVSKLIARPLAALASGLRQVSAGDYQARMVQEGGRELRELACGFNGMVRQLEELRQREGVMRRRERFAALGEAVAVIAHEIRNPLGIIKTSSEVIRTHGSLPTASERLLTFVLDEVGRIDHLVQDMLDYVSPVTTIEMLVDVRAELANVLEFARPELAKRRVVPLLLASGQDLVVLGDPRQLRQAFLNLVLNAIDAMPEGGQVTAAVSREDGAVIVSIVDSGVGVAAAIAGRMFEPFVTDKAHGTGLGLARVLHVVEAHGGTIAFSSAPGQGTCFTMRLPLPAGS